MSNLKWTLPSFCILCWTIVLLSRFFQVLRVLTHLLVPRGGWFQVGNGLSKKNVLKQSFFFTCNPFLHLRTASDIMCVQHIALWMYLSGSHACLNPFPFQMVSCPGFQLHWLLVYQYLYTTQGSMDKSHSYRLLFVLTWMWRLIYQGQLRTAFYFFHFQCLKTTQL